MKIVNMSNEFEFPNQADVKIVVAQAKVDCVKVPLVFGPLRLTLTMVCCQGMTPLGLEFT